MTEPTSVVDAIELAARFACLPPEVLGVRILWLDLDGRPVGSTCGSVCAFEVSVQFCAAPPAVGGQQGWLITISHNAGGAIVQGRGRTIAEAETNTLVQLGRVAEIAALARRSTL